MIDGGKPDIVLAFPGGRGTADMVRRAVAADIPVRTISATQAIETERVG
jgi:predicted polyphosphate/ATP-dependent NAD kinase